MLCVHGFGNYRSLTKNKRRSEMKSPKFQVGETVQTATWFHQKLPTKGVIKYKYYYSKRGEWFYIIRSVGADEHEGIVCGESILELSPPVKVVHCCCCQCKNSSISYPLSKFQKGQRVWGIRDGAVYFGKINCVIDMKTYYDYYVDICDKPTIRCNEKELCSCCCCHCHCC